MENTYLLSCFSSTICDRDSARNKYRRMSTMIYKFESDSDLCITRADDGYMTLQERTYIPLSHVLTQSCSINAGMKLRCRARGVSLAGSAKKHSYGPYFIEINGRTVGFTSKGGRDKAALTTAIVRMPPIGDSRMISLLESLFAGNEIDFDCNDLKTQRFTTSVIAEIALTNSQKNNTKTLTMGTEDPSGGPGGASSLLEQGPPSGASSESLLTRSPHPRLPSGGPAGPYRAAAAFAWNNLLGGKIVFAGVEARLTPWALLLPSVVASMAVAEGAEVGEEVEATALALLDQARRTVEACLSLRERGPGEDDVRVVPYPTRDYTEDNCL